MLKQLLEATQWSSLVSSQMKMSYFLKLEKFIESESKTKKIFPPKEQIFSAFELVKPEDVKVVIIGQDPYHGENQANGLAFSVVKECKTPPSLRNIFVELMDDMTCTHPSSPDLTQWAKEGVLLINSVLSVEMAKANSHKAKGWEEFTDFVIKKLSTEYEHIVFVLWGGESQKKDRLIDSSKHLILKAPHPSPLSSYRGFFGSKPFSKSNEYLKQHRRGEINWCLD
ncbi:MAG: uracil-DNA glycosylase [Sulfurimonas sp.]|uniref:uracil-DNA glycosylase n=1 Tax=Sulfurimonas sp. TaxID=2022749 RepID=UPI0025FD6C67|nr:uracil-DNA glycosylase [Sulfurimonas sp.]MCK9492106.1 uracil-DNA glycosylase [Sulfurimonas sp.]